MNYKYFDTNIKQSNFNFWFITAMNMMPSFKGLQEPMERRVIQPYQLILIYYFNIVFSSWK